MILAFDTSTAACTAALFDEGGECLASADELIGRGHAERLVPMLDKILQGRTASTILVGVGPGSFTGIRVAIAAAHGLAIGWDAKLLGFSSLALLAASSGVEGEVAGAMNGGHGELFVQQFDDGLQPTTGLLNLPPSEAAEAVSAEMVAGPASSAIIEARGGGSAIEAWPSASNVLRLPEPLRRLVPAPVYARAPDAKVRTAA
jgi:tRNA threonylcarbamoyl adenosine modification protein YeaZ